TCVSHPIPHAFAIKMPNGVTFTNFDTAEIYAANPAKTVLYDSAVLSQAANIPESVLEAEVIVQFGHAIHALGEARLEATVGALVADGVETNGGGISINLDQS